MYVNRSELHGYLPVGERFHEPIGSTSGGNIDAMKADLAVKYHQLRSMIVLQNAIAMSKGKPHVPVATLDNNLASMDRVYDRVRSGEWSKAPSLEQTARGILNAITMDSGSTSVANDVLRDILRIPRMIQDAIIAAAGTAGKAAGEAARGAGIDPAQVAADAGSGFRTLGFGVGAAAVILLAIKFL